MLILSRNTLTPGTNLHPEASQVDPKLTIMALDPAQVQGLNSSHLHTWLSRGGWTLGRTSIWGSREIHWAPGRGCGQGEMMEGFGGIEDKAGEESWQWGARAGNYMGNKISSLLLKFVKLLLVLAKDIFSETTSLIRISLGSL